MTTGIAGKLILVLGFCALLVLGVTGIVEYRAGTERISHEVAGKLDGICNRLTLTLRRSVYEFDNDTVRDTLLAEFSEPGMKAAAAWTNGRQRLLAALVRQADGKVKGDKELPFGKGFAERVLPLRFGLNDTDAGQNLVGEVALVFDQHHMEQQLLDEILLRQVKSALMVLLLLVILGEILRRALVKPLEKLHQMMLQAETHDFASADFKIDQATLIQENDPRIFLEMKQMTGAFRRLVEAVANRQVALRSSEQRYRNLLATAPLPILVHCDGIVLYLNQAATQLLQQPSAESLLGRSLLPFFSTDDDRGKLFQTFAGDLAAGGLHSLTLRIFLPPRELRDLEVTSIDLEYEGRRSQLMICLDVTEKLAAERELVEHRNRLEELVEERTVALRHTQEQLLLKERLAILGQLTATVSHELRNPMGSIGNALFNLQLAMEAKRDDLVVKSLQVANRSVERCDRIINELLDYSRKGNRESEELAIDHWLQELLGELVWPEQIRLRTELHSGIRIWGDTNRLRQAIQNLISNAQQALQEVDREDKVILVETRISDERLEIIVEDNGPGIPEDLQERIFEPLFSTKVYGVGLGMAVVEDVMRCHHGGVALQTPEDGGCRFVLWLPIGDDAGSNHGC